MPESQLSLAVNGREYQLHHKLALFQGRAGSPGGDQDDTRPVTWSAAIVGLGYVGLPTALALHGRCPRIIGMDVSEDRLAVIAAREADLADTDRPRLEAALADGSLELTSKAAAIGEADAVIICVPTPVDGDHQPDLTALRGACAAVVEQTRPGQTIILTSTTYVGTTRELLTEPLAARGLRAGTDVFVAFSPERIDPGNPDHLQRNTPRVVGGATSTLRGPRRLGHQPAHRRRVPGQLRGRRRGDEAVREHLPRGVARPGQRVRRRLRRPGARPDRGDAGRGHQALRFPGRVPRSGRRRSLHPLRSALPALAAGSQAATGTADQAGHAVHRRTPGPGGRPRRRTARRGRRGRRRSQSDRGRCRLQSRCPGFARVPGPAADGWPPPPWRPGLLPRSAGPGGAAGTVGRRWPACRPRTARTTTWPSSTRSTPAWTTPGSAAALGCSTAPTSSTACRTAQWSRRQT